MSKDHRVALAFVYLAVLLPLAGPAEPALVVTHATLWTGLGPQADREIVIERGRVTAAGAAGQLPRPKDAKVIDAAGDTLLPGLIDAHVHLVLGTRTPQDFPAAAVTAATAKQLLRSGVTSGRIHLWNLPEAAKTRRDSANDNFPAPRFVVGGPGLFGGQPTWENPTGNVWGVRSAEDAQEKVRRLHAAGVDWIALHDLRRFQPGEVEALVAEARKLGMRLMVGGDSFAEIERGLELGVDSLEYLDRSDAPLYSDALIAKLQARGDGLFLVPPMGFPSRFAAYRQGKLELDEPRFTEFFPPDAATFVRAALREDQTKEIPFAPKWTEVPPTFRGKFRQLRAAGLQLVIGTDCGSPAHFPADALWWEMETWRQWGVPVNEIVRAATVLPACLLRQSDIGHLGPGARGDFVLYRGRLDDGPLSVNRVRSVAKGGVLFVDDDLWVHSEPVPSAP